MRSILPVMQIAEMHISDPISDLLSFGTFIIYVKLDKAVVSSFWTQVIIGMSSTNSISIPVAMGHSSEEVMVTMWQLVHTINGIAE